MTGRHDADCSLSIRSSESLGDGRSRIATNARALYNNSRNERHDPVNRSERLNGLDYNWPTGGNTRPKSPQPNTHKRGGKKPPSPHLPYHHPLTFSFNTRHILFYFYFWKIEKSAVGGAIDTSVLPPTCHVFLSSSFFFFFFEFFFSRCLF